MVDKQIIVDGVDVSECNFCEWKSSDIPQCRIRLASFEPTCKGYNCHYKQLKHLEQENKELKEENRYYKAMLKLSCNELDKSNKWQIAERQEKNKYRSALEEIREKYLKLKEQNGSNIVQSNTVNEQLDQFKVENDKLEQALIEIKEIAEEEVHNRMLFADKKSFCDFNKILQKINEVI